MEVLGAAHMSQEDLPQNWAGYFLLLKILHVFAKLIGLQHFNAFHGCFSKCQAYISDPSHT